MSFSLMFNLCLHRWNHRWNQALNLCATGVNSIFCIYSIRRPNVWCCVEDLLPAWTRGLAVLSVGSNTGTMLRRPRPSLLGPLVGREAWENQNQDWAGKTVRHRWSKKGVCWVLGKHYRLYPQGPLKSTEHCKNNENMSAEGRSEPDQLAAAIQRALLEHDMSLQ